MIPPNRLAARQAVERQLRARFLDGQHSDHGNRDGREDREIKWEGLRESLVAELKAGVAKPKKDPAISYEDDGPWKAVHCLECLGKTDGKHGLLRLRWDQRKTWTIGSYRLGIEKYNTVKAKESIEWRALAGGRCARNALSRDVRASSIGQVFTGKPR